MSLLGQTLVLYALIGLGVAGAVLVRGDRPRDTHPWFQVVTAVPFWPLYMPVLLIRAATTADSTDAALSAPAADGMAAAIDQVDAELERALASLDGWAEDVLARERDRIHELGHAWTSQAERIREMDRLLALPDHALVPGDGHAMTVRAVNCPAISKRLEASCLARQQNIERLRQVRERAQAELMGTLTWVRELVSMIHLAKYTGAPASRAEELVAQIAAAVEGLSEVTWRDDSHVADSI